MKTFKTHNDKTIEMYYRGQNIGLKFKEGGELPIELSGIYTNEHQAEVAVLIYLDRHTPKHKKPTVTEEDEARIKKQNEE